MRLLNSWQFHGLILLTSLKIRPETKNSLCEPCGLEQPKEVGERKAFWMCFDKISIRKGMVLMKELVKRCVLQDFYLGVNNLTSVAVTQNNKRIYININNFRMFKEQTGKINQASGKIIYV